MVSLNDFLSTLTNERFKATIVNKRQDTVTLRIDHETNIGQQNKISLANLKREGDEAIANISREIIPEDLGSILRLTTLSASIWNDVIILKSFLSISITLKLQPVSLTSDQTTGMRPYVLKCSTVNIYIPRM